MMSDPKVHASRNKRLLFFLCPDCVRFPLHGILISSPVLPPPKKTWFYPLTPRTPVTPLMAVRCRTIVLYDAAEWRHLFEHVCFHHCTYIIIINVFIAALSTFSNTHDNVHIHIAQLYKSAHFHSISYIAAASIYAYFPGYKRVC